MEIIERWFKTYKNAVISQLSVKPIEHPIMKGKPLSVQKGQAIALFLVDDRGNWWILKKFNNTCGLTRNYLEKVGLLLPSNNGFVCGTQRKVLTKGALDHVRGFHYSKDLDKWLDGTILMPRVIGMDWAALAGDIRDKSINPPIKQRYEICKNLTTLVDLLEANQCSHRDLSCGNVFIDTATWQVYLIDFDSFYHPSLSMPSATTCGTTGYTSPLAWNKKGDLEPQTTWCQCADRFTLAILITEFLLTDPTMQATGDGGLFDQNELRARSGKGINSILSRLNSQHPLAAQLLDAAIKSSNFSNCPSPKDWFSFYNTIPGLMPPSLSSLPEIAPYHFTKVLNDCKNNVPLCSAPSLNDIAKINIKIPKANFINMPQVTLPPDPWQKIGG
jgi:serine/threonine protein kinase